MIHESRIHGRVLVVTLRGPMSPDLWHKVRTVMQEEVIRERPDHLVIDLRSLDSLYGAALIGFLVVSAVAMEQHGLRLRTKVLAIGEIAHQLPRILQMSRLESLLGEQVYPDIESAPAMPATGAS